MSFVSTISHRLGASLMAALAVVMFVPGSVAAADKDERKPRAKGKPVNLAAVKVKPKQRPIDSAAAANTDILAAPDFEIDPDQPEHLRPVRLFNKDGRFLDARLLAADSSTVTVQRIADNRTFDLEMESLDNASVRRVETWLDRGPETMDFSISFEVKKRMVESDTFSSVGRNFKMMNWVYDVVLTNQSRNELRNATLEYQIVYDDEVNIVRTSAYPGEGKDQRDYQSVDLPPLSYNGRAEFATLPVEMQTYEYEPTRGDREYRRDQIVGIWIRILKQGEIVAEYMSHPAAMEALNWDEDDEIEIIVRDSFKDQFESVP